jgi:hypothetical protein
MYRGLKVSTPAWGGAGAAVAMEAPLPSRKVVAVERTRQGRTPGLSRS